MEPISLLSFFKKKLTKAQKILCNFYKNKNLFKTLFKKKKFFRSKIKEGKDIIVHVNKVKALANQLTIINKSFKDGDIAMFLFISLFKFYNHFIITLESIKLIIDYIIARLNDKVTKKIGKEY